MENETFFYLNPLEQRIPISQLSDEQLETLKVTVADEMARRSEAREQYAEALTEEIRELIQKIENEGFEFMANKDQYSASECWVRWVRC